MAEEVKKKAPAKPRKPRAPKTPKAEPAVINPAAIEAEEKFEEEVQKVEENIVEPVTVTAEPPQPEEPESTELPENVTPFEEFAEELETAGPVEIKKLNPNLPDSKSKWVVRFATKTGGYHELFKGSYSRAYAAAQRRNKTLGFGGEVRKIRSK